ncbi:MAG: glycosyltransferase family 4 protein [Candidatus Eisenbacteria bacterium]|nr:glycosyltransferase family 4 protein [Candidatus Eisenbacteria bacterium]
MIDGAGGINLAQFHPDASRRAASPLRVLVNGRRSREKKGTDLILRALRGLERRLPPFEVVLFDSLGEHNRQDPRDGAPLPAHARFVIGPTQEELVALYQSSHVFVAAERKAGWCNTALEAMACGCAVACTGSGTRDFAREGENAIVSFRHPWFLRHAIRCLLESEPLRARLSVAGAAAVTPWTWDRLAARLLEAVAAAS